MAEGQHTQTHRVRIKVEINGTFVSPNTSCSLGAEISVKQTRVANVGWLLIRLSRCDGVFAQKLTVPHHPGYRDGNTRVWHWQEIEVRYCRRLPKLSFGRSRADKLGVGASVGNGMWVGYLSVGVGNHRCVGLLIC